MTSREFVLEHSNGVCCYCGGQAVHREHVVPKALRRRHHITDSDTRFHVSSCAADNWRKQTYRFFPEGFDQTILPGKGWKEWHGEPISEMFR